VEVGGRKREAGLVAKLEVGVGSMDIEKVAPNY